jgi:hypothetical protein
MGKFEADMVLQEFRRPPTTGPASGAADVPAGPRDPG